MVLVFGFGKGKIELELERYNYSPGETLRGTLTLHLKKPVKAKQLYVSLVGEEKRTRSTGKRSSTRTVTVFDFKQPVDGEKEYPAGTPLAYSFEVKIPADLLNEPESSQAGLLGAVMETVRMLSRRRVRWYIRSGLDVPMGLDVSKSIQINIV